MDVNTVVVMKSLRVLFLCNITLCAAIVPAVAGSTGIIVDHTAVEEFDSIPDVWLDEVKNMLIQVVGESHAA
ncbi:MAG: hypothetical protein DRP65_02235, partial [Planctomycetota bacterium]